MKEDSTMTDEKNILLPSPIIDAKEDDSIKKLCERYEKLITPGMLAKAGKKVVEVIPKPIKNVGKKAKDAITVSLILLLLRPRIILCLQKQIVNQEKLISQS